MNDPLLSAPWWREVLDRAGRNAVQTLIPVFIAAQAGSLAGFQPVNTLWVLGIAAAVTVLKAIAGIKADASAPLPVRLLDRAAPAAASTLVTFFTVGQTVASTVDWKAAAVATVSAAGLAVAQAFISPAIVAHDPDPVVAIEPGPEEFTPGPDPAEFAAGDDLGWPIHGA